MRMLQELHRFGSFCNSLAHCLCNWSLGAAPVVSCLVKSDVTTDNKRRGNVLHFLSRLNCTTISWTFHAIWFTLTVNFTLDHQLMAACKETSFQTWWKDRESSDFLALVWSW